MNLIDRQAERAAFEKRFSRRSSFSLMFGQRRTGKTYLLQYLASSRANAMHFLADESTAPMSLARFWGEVLEARVARGVSAVLQPTDWGSALTLLIQQAMSNDEPLFLFIDEVQYLIAAEPALPSILLRLWDQFRERASLHIVLCGSALGALSQLGHSGQPLHGRFDLKLKLLPFSFHQAGLFVDNWPLHERLKAYGVFGGLARHLAELEPGATLAENVVEILCDPLSSLAEAPMDILRSEHLSSLAEAAAVVEAMALGETRFNSIASRTNLTGARLSYVLNELLGLEIVRREARFGDRSGSKYSRYWIADPLVGFWFRFIRPNRAALAGGSKQRVWDQRIAPRLNDWMGPVFEHIVHQALRRRELEDQLGLVDEIGSYWSRDGQTQIDWIARTDRGLLFVECKWRENQPVGRDALRQLRDHASRYTKDSGPSLYCLASPAGFSHDLLAGPTDDVILLGPDELGRLPE